MSIGKDVSVFEMHKLVQLATRKWLEANEQLEVWKVQYIKILYEEFPTAEYPNWAKCQNLFAHTQTAVAQRPQNEESLLQWASILYKGGEYAGHLGHKSIAEEMAVKAMKARKKILGQEDKETLRSTSQIGLVYNMAGRLKEAEELEVRVLEISQKVFGQEDPDTLISMANLAVTYMDQGRWKEAEELQIRVMETRKRVLSEEHPDRLNSIANLALTYLNQGRWKEAEELEVRAIEIMKKVLGKEHPDTLTSMNNLALTY